MGMVFHRRNAQSHVLFDQDMISVNDSFHLPQSLFLRRNANRLLRRNGYWGHFTTAFKAHGEQPDSKRSFIASSFCINVVLRGTGRYETEKGYTYPLKPGRVFIRDPSVVHSTILDSHSNYAEWFLVFDTATAAIFNSMGICPPATVFSVGCSPLLLERMAELMEQIRQPQEKIGTVAIQIKVAAFLDYLYQRVNAEKESDTWSRIVDESCELLDNPEHDWIDLTQLARQLGVAYPSFRRAFAELKGMPPGEYRIRHRLNRACQLLVDNNIKEVSEQLRYADPFAFSAQFKRYMNISPSEYQESIGKR